MTPRGAYRVVVRGEREMAGLAAIPFVLWAVVMLFAIGRGVGLIGLVLGAARAAYWYAVVAKRAVVETADGLAYLATGGICETVRWTDIREIRLLEGQAFPEWPRWYAQFPRVRVMVAGPDGRVAGGDLGEVLLRTQPSIDRASRALADVDARHGVPFVNATD